MTDIEQQVEQALNMNEEDLYNQLGMASLGTNTFTKSLQSMDILKNVALNTNSHFATKLLGDHLQEEGKAFFLQTFNTVKKLICTIYNDKINVGDKDLATYIVSAIIAAGVLSNALVILLCTGQKTAYL